MYLTPSLSVYVELPKIKRACNNNKAGFQFKEFFYTRQFFSDTHFIHVEHLLIKVMNEFFHWLRTVICDDSREKGVFQDGHMNVLKHTLFSKNFFSLT